jgi:hypothetical protein
MGHLHTMQQTDIVERSPPIPNLLTGAVEGNHF